MLSQVLYVFQDLRRLRGRRLNFSWKLLTTKAMPLQKYLDLQMSNYRLTHPPKVILKKILSVLLQVLGILDEDCEGLLEGLYANSDQFLFARSRNLPLLPQRLNRFSQMRFEETSKLLSCGWVGCSFGYEVRRAYLGSFVHMDAL
ncbi:hypothetical protein X731_03790 [Mesorhizobium sp. L2C054A000]|nr:hypothetical protein X731_03790 [Mesorhizobium sp. L2C054A000]